MAQSSFLYFNSILFISLIFLSYKKFQDYIQPVSSGNATLPLLAGFRLCLKIEKASHIFGVYLRLPVSFFITHPKPNSHPRTRIWFVLESQRYKIFK